MAWGRGYVSSHDMIAPTSVMENDITAALATPSIFLYSGHLGLSGLSGVALLTWHARLLQKKKQCE